MNRKSEREFYRPNSVPNQSTVGLPNPSYAQATRKSTSSLERPFGHTQQGRKNEFEREGQYQQGDPIYKDESQREYADQQHGVQTQFVCSGQEVDKQDQHIDGSRQPSTIKHVSNKSRSTSNSKGGMTPNSHARSSLHSAFNIVGSNRPTDRQPQYLHVASFSPSDTSVKSRPTNPNGTHAPYQGIRCNMSMTGGKDGASNIVPGKPSLDGFDEGPPQNQVSLYF